MHNDPDEFTKPGATGGGDNHMRGTHFARCLLCLLLVSLASVSTGVSSDDLHFLKSTDPTAVWKWIHSDGVGLREPIESFASSDAGPDSSEGDVGQGHLTVSDGQQFTAVCGADGSFKIYRVQMYPNLYPDWGYLLYGRGWAEGGPSTAVECSLSEDASVLLWSGIRNHKLTAQIFLRGKSHSPERTSSCHGEVLNQSRFEIVFPQDNYNDVWAPLQSALVLGVQPVLATALSRNGEWLALIRDNELSFASLQCKHAPSVQALSLPDGIIPSSEPDLEDGQYAMRGRVRVVFSADSRAAWIVPRSPQAASTIPVARLSAAGQWELASISLAPEEAAALARSCSIAGAQARGVCDAEVPFASGVEGSCDAQVAAAQELLVSRACDGTVHVFLVAQHTSVRLFQTIPSSSKTSSRGVGLSGTGRVLAVSASGPQKHRAAKASDSVDIYLWDARKGRFVADGSLSVRGRVHSLAVSSLKRHYVLAFVSAPSTRDANGGFSTLLTASSAARLSPSHHPRAKQEDFYLTPPCAFPVDRSCTQRPADYDQEWGGLLAASSACPFLFVVAALCLVRAIARAPPRWLALRTDPAFAFVWRLCGGRRGEGGGQDAGRTARDARRCGQGALDVVCCGLLGFSCFEVLCEPAFVNDWPAHLHHVRQYREGRLDVGHYMHFHGNNPYAAMFLHVYTSLHTLANGSLPPFQLLWALVEVLSMRALGSLALDLNLDPLVAILPLLSNRLHLYQVRVVTNDGLNAAMMLSAVRLVAMGEWAVGSVLYGLVLGSKLNFITFLPAWLWACFHADAAHWRHPNTARVDWSMRGGVMRAGGGVVVLVLTQAVIGAPFLAGNAEAYMRTCFDLSRNLLWDKTRVFKWVGRLVYTDRRFHLLLLAISAVILLAIFLPIAFPSASSAVLRRRLLLFGLLASNQVIVGLAKAMYTPFLAWFFYSLPLILGIAGCPTPLLVVCWGLHEFLFRPFGDAASDSWGSLALLLCFCLLLVPWLLRFRAAGQSCRSKR